MGELKFAAEFGDPVILGQSLVGGAGLMWDEAGCWKGGDFWVVWAGDLLVWF